MLVNYRGRVISTRLPRFQGTWDLKFSVAEQEAIRDAEAVYGYRPQETQPTMGCATTVAGLLVGGFAVWLGINAALAVAKLVEREFSPSAIVQTEQRPRSAGIGRLESRSEPDREPRPSPQLVESFYPYAGDRPEPSTVANFVRRNVDAPGIAVPQAFHEGQNGIQAGTSDRPATDRQETEPASCPEGQSIARVAYVNAADGHIFMVVHCKPRSSSDIQRGASHTEPEGQTSDSASLQQPSDATEPQSPHFENSLELSSVSVEPRWLSFEPSHGEMLSGAGVADGKPFPTQTSISPARRGRAVKQRSLLRRALGGVGGSVLGAVRSVAASVRGEIWGD